MELSSESEDGEHIGPAEGSVEYWKKVALEFQKRYENVAANGVTTGSTTAGGGAPVLVGKLTIGHQRALKYHVVNNAWMDVKFIPNIHVFKINPAIMQQAKQGMGIEKELHGDVYDASLMARYKYEINQKRCNVKTAIRKKYRGKRMKRKMKYVRRQEQQLIHFFICPTGVWLDCLERRNPIAEKMVRAWKQYCCVEVARI